MSWFTQTWFMQGIMHPVQTPAHIILILGLAFLLGQQKHISIIFLLPFSILAGLALNHFSLINWNTELILLMLALICGLLLVLRLNLPSYLSFIILVFCGVILGLDSSPVMIPGLGSNSVYSWRLGAVVTMSLSIIGFAFFAYIVSRFWNGIILRVAGSWIATSAIFVLTLMLAGNNT